MSVLDLSSLAQALATIDPAPGAVAPVAAGRYDDLDRSLAALREESARTLTLMRALRTSPLYDFASTDPRVDGDW